MFAQRYKSGGYMLYKNYTNDAVSELERQRTGNYGSDLFEEDSDIKCCECKNSASSLFKINSKYYCSDCICELLREIFSDMADECDSYDIGAKDILKDIISDFSDNELLYYVENRYETIC